MKPISTKPAILVAALAVWAGQKQAQAMRNGYNLYD